MEGFFGVGLFCCSVFMEKLVMLISSLTGRSYQCMSNLVSSQEDWVSWVCMCHGESEA